MTVGHSSRFDPACLPANAIFLRKCYCKHQSVPSKFFPGKVLSRLTTSLFLTHKIAKFPTSSLDDRSPYYVHRRSIHYVRCPIRKLV